MGPPSCVGAHVGMMVTKVLQFPSCLYLIPKRRLLIIQYQYKSVSYLITSIDYMKHLGVLEYRSMLKKQINQSIMLAI